MRQQKQRRQQDRATLMEEPPGGSSRYRVGGFDEALSREAVAQLLQDAPGAPSESAFVCVGDVIDTSQQETFLRWAQRVCVWMLGGRALAGPAKVAWHACTVRGWREGALMFNIYIYAILSGAHVATRAADNSFCY